MLENGAAETAQVVKGLPRDHEDSSSDAQNKCPQAQWCACDLVLQELSLRGVGHVGVEAGGRVVRDRLEAHWLTSLSETIISRFSKSLSRRIKVKCNNEKTPAVYLWPPYLCTHMHMYSNACTDTPALTSPCNTTQFPLGENSLAAHTY